ncbi:MAG: glycosyltransferase WbuB [Candidatus Ozemobacteraceae bacterium]
MKILIHGLNFSPELTGIGKFTGEMVQFLAKAGQHVRVVCAPPYYPDWKVHSGFSGTRFQQFDRCGATVFRCPLYVPQKPSGITRIAHLASFAVSSLPVVLWQALTWRPHIILTIKPPIFCAPQALLAARLSGARAWMHIQDFELDAGFSLLGIGRSKGLRDLIGHAERLLLNRFHRVSTISPAMMRGLIAKGVPTNRQVYFPNWVDLQAIRPWFGHNPWKQRLGLTDGITVALYSGNLGTKQGIEIITEAARLLVDSPIQFVICGEGAGKAQLLRLAEGLPNILFLPLQPVEELNFLLNLGDIHLLPQRSEAESLVMPSKLTGIMAAGKPVIATLRPDSDLAHLIGNAGIITPPGDAKAFSNAIIELARDPQRRLSMGHAARTLAEREFNKDEILARFLDELQRLCKD